MRRAAQYGTVAWFLLSALVACTEARRPAGAAGSPGNSVEAGRRAMPIDAAIPPKDAGPEPAGSGGSLASGGTGGAQSNMAAAGSGSGTTACRPLPCPSGAPWNAQTCTCDSSLADGGDACMVDSECVLVPRGCCSCPPRNVMSMIATHRTRQQAVQIAQCDGPRCNCPATPHDPLASIVRASCVDNKCKTVDLRQLALSKCAQDSDCVAEGLGCCGAFSGNPTEYVGVHKDADDSILQCVPAPPCVPTPPPAPPPITYCASDGHCAVRGRETLRAVESTTCYSPSQNLDHAYDDGAEGCDCGFGPGRSLCRQDSMGRFVGLLCHEQGYWQAVNDGPCGKMP